MGIDWQREMRRRTGVILVGAPAIGPNACGPQQLTTGAQDNAEWFFIEYQWQARHDDSKTGDEP
jgi:hypothetical protein